MKSNFPQNFSPFQCVVRVSPGHHTVNVPIEKNGGCPQMYCQVCQKPFRWTEIDDFKQVAKELQQENKGKGAKQKLKR